MSRRPRRTRSRGPAVSDDDGPQPAQPPRSARRTRSSARLSTPARSPVRTRSRTSAIKAHTPKPASPAPGTPSVYDRLESVREGLDQSYSNSVEELSDSSDSESDGGEFLRKPQYFTYAEGDFEDPRPVNEDSAWVWSVWAGWFNRLRHGDGQGSEVVEKPPVEPAEPVAQPQPRSQPRASACFQLYEEFVGWLDSSSQISKAFLLLALLLPMLAILHQTGVIDLLFFAEFFGTLFGSITDFVNTFSPTLGGFLTSLFDFLAGVFWGFLDFLGQVTNFVFGMFTGAFSFFYDVFATLFNFALGLVTGVLAFVGSFFTSIWEGLTAVFCSIIPVCYECNVANCHSCSDENQCSSCDLGYQLQPDTGVCQRISCGVGCSVCLNENDCVSCDANYYLNLESKCENCPAHSTSAPGSLRCACTGDFSGDAHAGGCNDQGMCEFNANYCHASMNCVDAPGAGHPSCVCKPDFQAIPGDNSRCVGDLGLCANNPVCHRFAECTDVPGASSPKCECPDGYIGNGKHCAAPVDTSCNCQSEISRLEDRIRALENNPMVPITVTSDLKEARSQIDNLRNVISDKASAVEVGALKERVAAIDASVGTKASNDDLDVLRASVADKASISDVNALRDTVTASKQALDDLTAKVAQLESTVNQHSSDIAELQKKEDIAQLKKDIAHQEHTLAQLQKDVEIIVKGGEGGENTEINAAEFNVLREHVKTTQTDLEALSAKVDGFGDVRADIQALNDRVSSLEEAVRKAQTAADEARDATEARLVELQSSVNPSAGGGNTDELRKQIEAAQSTLKVVESRLAETEGVQDKIAALEKEIAAVKATSDQAQTQSGSSNTGTAVDSEELQKLQSSLDAQKKALEDQLAAQKQNSEADLAAQKKELQDKIDALESQISQAVAESDAVATLKDQVKALEKVPTELSNLEAKIKEAEAQIQQLSEQPAGETDTTDLEARVKALEEWRTKVEQWQKVIDNFKARAKDADPAVGDNVNEVIKKALFKFDADKTQKIDFAAQNGGGRILQASPSYTSPAKESGVLSWLKDFSVPPKKANTILEESMHLGSCWPVDGSNGWVFIQLREKIVPTAVSYEHISQYIAPDPSTTPTKIEIFGIDNFGSQEKQKAYKLGTLNYDTHEDRDPLQEVDLACEGCPEEEKTFQIIRMDLKANNGHKDYTCMYRLRVHGYTPHPQ